VLAQVLAGLGLGLMHMDYFLMLFGSTPIALAEVRARCRQPSSDLVPHTNPVPQPRRGTIRQCILLVLTRVGVWRGGAGPVRRVGCFKTLMINEAVATIIILWPSTVPLLASAGPCSRDGR
jgi:hypothetical protein